MTDKRRRTGERLKNVAGVQRALHSVGSSQNITLTALAKSRRVLFVEGLDDFRLLRRFARKVGMQELSAGIGITSLESGAGESRRGGGLFVMKRVDRIEVRRLTGRVVAEENSHGRREEEAAQHRDQRDVRGPMGRRK
jgi:hypothetical protein